jgi:hypothetical protein
MLFIGVGEEGGVDKASSFFTSYLQLEERGHQQIDCISTSLACGALIALIIVFYVITDLHVVFFG